MTPGVLSRVRAVAAWALSGADGHDDYFECERGAVRLQRLLSLRAECPQRSEWLSDLALTLDAMADAAARFTPSSVYWATPAEYAAWTRAEADIVAAVAVTEWPEGWHEDETGGGPGGGAARPLWAALTAERDRDARAGLMEDLADVIAPWLNGRGTDGNQAAEVLYALASCERKAGDPARRRYRPVPRWRSALARIRRERRAA